MTALDDDTRLTPLAPGRWRGEITDRWSVRAPNGGYVATYLTRALMEAAPAPDPIALNVHYVAPARPGDAIFEADVIRAGRSHATLAARLFQADDLVAVTLATFGRRRPGRELLNTPMPEVPPPDECGRRLERLVPGLTIGDRFDNRLPPGGHAEVGGEGHGTMTAGGWKRLLDRELDDLAVPLFMDSWPPSVWGVSESGGILPTVEMTFHWRAPPSRPWHLAWFTTTDVRDGYFVENGCLWGDDGTLVAQSRQIARFVEPQR
jgi:acyl-CoA thioesterase